MLQQNNRYNHQRFNIQNKDRKLEWREIHKQYNIHICVLYVFIFNINVHILLDLFLGTLYFYGIFNCAGM